MIIMVVRLTFRGVAVVQVVWVTGLTLQVQMHKQLIHWFPAVAVIQKAHAVLELVAHMERLQIVLQWAAHTKVILFRVQVSLVAVHLKVHVVKVNSAQLWHKQAAVLKAVVTRATTLFVMQRHVTTEAAKLATLQTAWARASKIMYIQIGLAIHIAMMVRIFLQIMDTAVLPA
jgi:hypothetical protein